MFPGMSVLRRKSLRSNLENTHTKIIRPVVLADNHSARNFLGLIIIKMGRGD
jgi:hypothetical protein